MAEHQRGHPYLADAGREMAVPKPGHPFAQLIIGLHHPIQPPHDQLLALLAHLLAPRLLFLLWRFVSGCLLGTRDPRQVRRWDLIGTDLAVTGRQVLLERRCEPALLHLDKRTAGETESKSVAQAPYDGILAQLAHGDRVGQSTAKSESRQAILQQINRFAPARSRKGELEDAHPYIPASRLSYLRTRQRMRPDHGETSGIRDVVRRNTLKALCYAAHSSP